MDEAGIPSRHRWMRTYNPSKPNKYFIEILMACDSTTRFCWGFFVTEGAKKTVKNRHRAGRNKSKFAKVEHFQPEYGPREREIQQSLGAAPAQMVYFARLLREKFDSPITYRIFTDRRWDSLPGIIIAKKDFNISYTATVNKASRYHVIKHWCKKGSPVVAKSKARNRRGKYRSATTTIEGVVLNTCLWNDSNLLGGISADLGTENRPVGRRMGRHTPLISCPIMMYVRGKFLRGVDVHDQLRACKYRIVFMAKGKAWPKLIFGLFEILLINIYIVKEQCTPPPSPDTFRWTLLLGMVEKAEELENEASASDQVAEVDEESDVEDDVVPRFKGADLHHWELLAEYVTPHEAEENQLIVDASPSDRELSRRPRQRDRNRKDGKVRNPLWTSASVCLVCKYQYGVRKETNRYCRECCVASFTSWPSTNRATGFAKEFHPRLCSKECFRFFHTHNIKGLDYAQKRHRTPSTRGSSNTPSTRNNIQFGNTRGASEVPLVTTPAGTSRVSRRRLDLPRSTNTRHDV